MIRALSHNLPLTDEEFDKIYSKDIQEHSKLHWTPVNIAKKATEFLVSKPKTKVLDIGSGVGKFCIIGALTTDGYFYGVEKRKNLVSISEEIVKKYNLRNIQFLNFNIVDVDFKKYDAFYFYNSFHENIASAFPIDDDLDGSLEKYLQYRDFLLEEFAKAPLGTRIVTYSGFDVEIPPCYSLVKAERSINLKFWIKDKAITAIPVYY